jgi:two-component system response regulator NreC
MADEIRVLIADDHTIVRSGVRLLLEAEPDIEVVGEALNGDEALTCTETLRPNVVLMDIAMPGMDGLEATRRIKARWPTVNVLVLTMHRTSAYFFEMLKAGASGYVLKSAETGELINAVRVVAQGEVYLYPTLAQQLVQNYLAREDGVVTSEPSLSPRETEILQLLAEGYSNTEIATKLVLSPSTVHTHRGNLMNKLGLSHRRELIQYARERGLLRDF